MIDLAALPDIQFCETDAAAVQAEVLAGYEAVTGRTLYPGDPERLFLEGLAYVIALQRFAIDYAGKMNLLRYAAGDYLEHLGALTEVYRLPPAAASCTVRFSANEALPGAAPIPAGTRVTPDGTLLFATTAAAEIAAGELFADVTAVALVPGAAGNGFLPAQINRLVDPVAGVATVANVTLTLGGADAEGDEPLRERIQLSPESFATAGPRLAYVYWVKSTHQDVLDVSVTSPVPGQVDVRLLATGGESPAPELVASVLAMLSEDKRRPLTDQVAVAAPGIEIFDVDVSWWVAQPSAALAAQIQTAVTAAVEGYVSWQRSRIGRDVNPSELTRRIMAAGAKRVEVRAPAYAALDATQVAQPGEVSVVYGGVEPE